MIYYANDFNLETRIQSEDRCHRIGQQNPVTYIDLITEKTIDEKIVQALRNKIDNTANKVMLDLENKGYHPESKTHIHSSTLKAFIKERVENGKPIDLDLFGAFVAKTADIKRK